MIVIPGLRWGVEEFAVVAAAAAVSDGLVAAASVAFHDDAAADHELSTMTG